MITKKSDPAPEVLWAEKKRREIHNQTVRVSKDNKPDSANNRNQTFTIEQLRSRMYYYNGYKIEPPPFPGTKLPDLSLDYQLKFTKLELEIHSRFKVRLVWHLTICVIACAPIAAGIIFGLPKLTIGIPFIMFLFLWVRDCNEVSNEKSWLHSTKLYVRKQLLKNVRDKHANKN